jgi:hypothetical protein
LVIHDVFQLLPSQHTLWMLLRTGSRLAFIEYCTPAPVALVSFVCIPCADVLSLVWTRTYPNL